MQIIEKIESDFKRALKSKDEITVSTLRMLKAAIHNKEIEKKGQKLQQAEVVKIIGKQMQQRKDSIEQFTKGKREELAAKEGKELEILKKYFPEQLSAQEVTGVVRKVIAELGAKDKADFGKVMKQAMAELKGTADGKLVSQIVSSRLGLG